MKRVVITGIGIHSPLGHEADAVFDAMLADRHGIVAMPSWSKMEDLNTLVAAPVDFSGRHIPRKVRRTMGRVALLGASAAQRAVADSGLSSDLIESERTSIVAGSTAGSGGSMSEFWSHLHLQRSARGLRSTLFFQGMAHTVAANIALFLGITGELLATNSACSSSSQAIGVGAERIRLGKADIVLVGGAEELHVSGGVIFDSLQAATTSFNDHPELTPRPFDRQRDGIVVGEGAGMLVLEEYAHARARGARIYGEVLGWGTSCDARHMANADVAGMRSAIRRCLADARCEPETVDYINAHATGTRAGDAVEAEALYQMFGDQVPVSSSKGHFGHTLGACGVIESIVCLMAMQRQIVPSTRNLVDPDVASIWLPTTPQRRAVHRVLNTNFAFGGVNSVLLLGAMSQ